MQGITPDSDRHRQTVVIEMTPKPKLTIRIPNDDDEDNSKTVRVKREIKPIDKICCDFSLTRAMVATCNLSAMIFLAYLEPKTLVVTMPAAICYGISNFPIEEN